MSAKYKKYPYVVFQSIYSIQMDAPIGCTGSVEFSLRFGKSYSYLPKASGDTFRLSLGAGDSIFLRPFRETPDDCVGLCSGTGMCAHDVGERAYTVAICVFTDQY